MTETGTIAKWDGVPEAVRGPLELLVEHLQAGLGGHLQSITVVGSSLTDDYRSAASDINTVVVLDEQNSEVLAAVASLGKTLRRKRLSPPLLMTPSYIDCSRDVFGIEFLDFQLRHRTILGDDPFSAISIDKGDVRLQCERELKAMLIRMRQGYIAAAGSKKLVRDILISTAKGLAPLVRALLWLKDIERPTTMEATLRKAAAEFNVDLKSVIAAERWRHEKPRPTDAEIDNAFTAVVGAVNVLTTTVDEMKL